MGINYPIGYSALLSHKVNMEYKPNVVYTSEYPNGVIYAVGMRNIHTALMGDPTLRLFAYNVPEPINLTVSVENMWHANLQWEHSPKIDAMSAKYNVYRSTEKYGIYTKVNKEPIVGTKFVDSTFKFEGEVFYSVRTLALETSNSATFFNTSKGIFASATLTSVENELTNDFDINIYPNPATTDISIELSIKESGNYNLSIYDMMGDLQNELINEYFNLGLFKFNSKLQNNKGNSLSNGVYLLQLKSGNRTISKKINVIR